MRMHNKLITNELFAAEFFSPAYDFTQALLFFSFYLMHMCLLLLYCSGAGAHLFRSWATYINRSIILTPEVSFIILKILKLSGNVFFSMFSWLGLPRGFGGSLGGWEIYSSYHYQESIRF